jgi:hypothetical protein
VSADKIPEFTKADLEAIHRNLSRVLPPGGRPISDPSEIVSVNAVLEKTRVMITAGIGAVERGARILAWRIPCDVAPTQNELINWNARSPWLPKKAKHWLEEEIRKLKETTPGLDLCGAQKIRFVRVTRFTAQPRNVDNDAPDVIGGKLPIDMLVRAGVFVNDSQRWLRREGSVRKTPIGNTHVFVEIHEASDSEVTDAGPEDGPKPMFAWPKSRTRKHLDETLGDQSKRRRK